MQPPSVGDRSNSISSAVVDALAAAGDTDPLALDPPLYDVVDPDALDALFRTPTRGTVQFEYGDHLVAVRSDGTVTVDGRAHDQL